MGKRLWAIGHCPSPFASLVWFVRLFGLFRLSGLFGWDRLEPYDG